MNTQEFLKCVLPDSGIKIVAAKMNGKFKHKGFETVEDAAAFALKCDAEELETYHACAAYKERPHLNQETGKYVARVSSNWLCAKAFWVDIDCGPDKAEAGKGYATQIEGAKALLEWCKDNEVPYPMVINSGRGIHAYWCLDHEISAAEWVQTANSLKTALNSAGILADPSRTADFASILRPVGTHNHKGAEPLEVKLVRPQKTPIDFELFRDKVSALGGAFDIPSWLAGEKSEALVDYPEVKYSAEEIASKCPAVAKMRDTQGDVSYDHWRAVIGLTTFCVEGIETAIKWSAKRADTGHNNVDVETRFNTWHSAPPTCGFFEACDPSLCAQCPHKGKINTPLRLGMLMPEPKKDTAEGIVEGQTTKEVTVEIPPLPEGYAWDEKTQQMVRFVRDKDGSLSPEPFCQFRFYLVDRIKEEDGTFKFRARAHMPKGIIRDFYLDGSVAGVGGNKLLELLGNYEILTTNSKNAGAHMHAYVKDSICSIAARRAPTSTFSHFGWQKDQSFLIGNRLFRPDGTMIETLLSGHAVRSAQAFPPPKGTLEGYAEHLNAVYNRKGMEPLQYLICSLWAAPLVEFCGDDYNGIPCAVTGAQSGKGKTTAALAALYAFGEPYPNLCITGKEGATVKAQATLIGTMKNLPMLFDEVTNKSSYQLSDLCYALSNGVESLRLRSTGGRVEFGDRESWRTHVAMTGNTHIGARLAENGNTEAEAMRLFEIRIDSYGIPKLNPVWVSDEVMKMKENQGCAGEAIIKFLVTQRAEAMEILHKAQEMVHGNAELIRQPKYRFYRNHMACTLAMAMIAKQLGIADFDVKELAKFAETAVSKIFEDIALNALPAGLALAQMLTELSPKIARTLTMEVSDGAQPYDIKCPQGLVGRTIVGNRHAKDEHNGRMYLAANAIRSWCNANRVDYTDFANRLTMLGVLKSRNERVSLGKGTNVTIPQQRCWALDVKAMESLEPFQEEKEEKE